LKGTTQSPVLQTVEAGWSATACQCSIDLKFGAQFVLMCCNMELLQLQLPMRFDPVYGFCPCQLACCNLSVLVPHNVRVQHSVMWCLPCLQIICACHPCLRQRAIPPKGRRFDRRLNYARVNISMARVVLDVRCCRGL